MYDLLTSPEVTIVANICTIVGFIITVLTFLVASNVRKQIIYKDDKEKYRQNKTEVISIISAHINSIKDNNLVSNSFINTIYLDVIDISTSYLFFRRKTKKCIKSVLELTENRILPVETDYNKIVVALIKLRSQLEREE